MKGGTGLLWQQLIKFSFNRYYVFDFERLLIVKRGMFFLVTSSAVSGVTTFTCVSECYILLCNCLEEQPFWTDCLPHAPAPCHSVGLFISSAGACVTSVSTSHRWGGNIVNTIISKTILGIDGPVKYSSPKSCCGFRWASDGWGHPESYLKGTVQCGPHRNVVQTSHKSGSCLL